MERPLLNGPDTLNRAFIKALRSFNVYNGRAPNVQLHRRHAGYKRMGRNPADRGGTWSRVSAYNPQYTHVLRPLRGAWCGFVRNFDGIPTNAPNGRLQRRKTISAPPPRPNQNNRLERPLGRFFRRSGGSGHGPVAPVRRFRRRITRTVTRPAGRVRSSSVV